MDPTAKRSYRAEAVNAKILLYGSLFTIIYPRFVDNIVLRMSDFRLWWSGTPTERGGGALRYQMDTHYQTVITSRSSECQNVVAVSSVEKKERDSQLETNSCNI